MQTKSPLSFEIPPSLTLLISVCNSLNPIGIDYIVHNEFICGRGRLKRLEGVEEQFTSLLRSERGRGEQTATSCDLYCDPQEDDAEDGEREVSFAVPNDGRGARGGSELRSGREGRLWCEWSRVEFGRESDSVVSNVEDGVELGHERVSEDEEVARRLSESERDTWVALRVLSVDHVLPWREHELNER